MKASLLPARPGTRGHVHVHVHVHVRPRPLPWLLVAATVALLAGCASRQQPLRDGADARPPPWLERVPDAEPRIEPLRAGGPNKPYEVFGQRYVPLTADLPLQDDGLASWYGRKFHGLPTSSGEPYDMYAMTAAHRTMPIPSYARVRNPANGREVVVRINDRGPFAPGRVIDLSYTAALKLGVLAGVAPVQVQRLTFADIRAGLPSGPVAIPPVTAVAVLPAPAVAPVPVVAATFAPAALVPGVLPVGPATSASTTPPMPSPAQPALPLPPDDPLPGDAVPAATGFWVQLGAFRQRDGAVQLQQRLLAGSEPLPGVAVFDEGGIFRVQAGPYAARDAAEQAAARWRRQAGLGGGALVVDRQARR